MNNYSVFIFESYNFDRKNKILKLNYSYDNKLFFEEKIEFPSGKILDENELICLDNIFKYLHIIAGISYYKLFIPYKIEIKTFTLNKEQADFFNNFYFKGLGEFSFKNNIIDLKERINFPYSNSENTKDNEIINYKLKNKVVIPIGGGKDSIVTLNIIKKYLASKNILLCSIGKAKPIEETINLSGYKSFHPIRTIAKNLIELNKNLDKTKNYNGHIPITGILAFIMCAGAIIYDYDTVLMSNERSANIGNVDFHGNIVNHQWSKSFEFEKSVNYFFKKYLLNSFNYFSFLRPLSEIHIAKIFTRFKEYFPIFTSCNKNFKIENRLDHWCCNCDKCRFVFLILSIFLKKEEMIKIFGKNLLDDKNQLNGYLELCGLKDHKPFECVGEIEESVYGILNVDKSFKNDFVVNEISKLLENKYSIDEIKNIGQKLFTPEKKNNLLNSQFWEYLKKNV